MTAPLLTLPISAPAASGGGQAAPGAAGAMGFEALMAAFFATGEDEAGAAQLGEGEKADNTGDAEAAATDATPTTPVDAQTLAALLAVTPQAAPVVTDPATGEAGQPPQGQTAPTPTAFAPLLAQEIAAAPAADGTKASTSDAAAAAALPSGEPSDVEAPDVALAATPAHGGAKSDGLDKTPAQVVETPRQAAAAEQTKAQAPVPAPPSPPPVQPQVAEAAVETQVAAAEVEIPVEPVKEPAKPAKADAGRRTGATTSHTTPAPAVTATDAAAVAPAAAADTDSSEDPALAIDGEAVATLTSRETTKPQTADGPDAQGPASTAAAAHNAAGPLADAPLPVRGSPETVAHLAAQIVKKLEGRSTRFDVELNPAGLGHVNVSVEIGAQGKMTAALQFESAQAANELRGRAPELQKALEQAGFDLSGGGLSFDVAGDRGQGQGRGDLYQQQQQQNDGGAWRGRAFQAVLDTADGAAEAAAAAALHLQRRPTTGVDVRV